MSKQSLSSIRRSVQLHGNKKFTAIEVGHLLNAQGYGRVSYRFLAWKTGYCRRTIIRHMHALVVMRIFQKTVYKLANGYAINLYKCLLPIVPFYRGSPHGSSGDSVSPILPTHATNTAKEQSLSEEIRRQEWAVHNLAMTADARARCVEEIARLKTVARRQ